MDELKNEVEIQQEERKKAQNILIRAFIFASLFTGWIFFMPDTSFGSAFICFSFAFSVGTGIYYFLDKDVDIPCPWRDL